MDSGESMPGDLNPEEVRLLEFWVGLPRRPNIKAASESVGGAYVRERVRLNPEVARGRYKFVIDLNCRIWIGLSTAKVSGRQAVPGFGASVE